MTDQMRSFIVTRLILRQSITNDAAFSEADHRRLKQCLSSIKGRFILSYNDSEFIRELYRDFEICSVERPNNLSRGTYKELIIKNY